MGSVSPATWWLLRGQGAAADPALQLPQESGRAQATGLQQGPELVYKAVFQEGGGWRNWTPGRPVLVEVKCIGLLWDTGIQSPWGPWGQGSPVGSWYLTNCSTS